MYEVLVIAGKVFFVIYDLALIIGALYFAFQIQECWSKYKVIKKEYVLSPWNVKKGHSGRSKKDIEPKLICIKVEMISWLCIFLINVYVCIDCWSLILK